MSLPASNPTPQPTPPPPATKTPLPVIEADRDPENANWLRRPKDQKDRKGAADGEATQDTGEEA